MHAKEMLTGMLTRFENSEARQGREPVASEQAGHQDALLFVLTIWVFVSVGAFILVIREGRDFAAPRTTQTPFSPLRSRTGVTRPSGGACRSTSCWRHC